MLARYVRIMRSRHVGYASDRNRAKDLRMKRMSAVSGLFVILALVGLVFAPAAPSLASSAMAMNMAVEMSGDMECCPDDQPAIPDCAKDCPFAVVCTAVFVSAPVSESLPLGLRISLKDRFPPCGDTEISSLVGDPPPRPPKA